MANIHAAGGIDPNSAGYVTEKLYMLLQLYLQNKGWSPSPELLQCFAELKDSLPNAAYLQVLASRLALDGQGRLVLRDNGKIVLPFEHFANAVMLKHMSGPHGLHLSLEATMRAVIESYTIGRDNFGMEEKFIIEVVNSCPNPACRYYKSHMNPFVDVPTTPSPGSNSGGGGGGGGGVGVVGGLSVSASGNGNNISIDLTTAELAAAAKTSQQQQQQQQQQLLKQQQLSHHQQQQQQQQIKSQQQLSNAILQQQNRVLAAAAQQSSLEKFNSLSAIEKQRMLVAAMCPPPSSAVNQSSNANSISNIMNNTAANPINLAATINSPQLPSGSGVGAGGGGGGSIGIGGIITNNANSITPSTNTTNSGSSGVGNNCQQVATLNAMKQQLSANNLAAVAAAAASVTNNGNNSNLIMGTAPGSTVTSAQNQQRQELQLQQQMLLNLSSQAQHLQGQAQTNLLSSIEAHSLKINEYLRNSNNIENCSGGTAAMTPSATPPSSSIGLGSGAAGSSSAAPSLDAIPAANKDLSSILALHNGAWGNNNNNTSSTVASGIATTGPAAAAATTTGNNQVINTTAEFRGDGVFAGQDKIVRVFTELMRNMAKMKTFIRPSMCKPYGKQSESLQKSLMDTIQLVQSLRNCLPAPHIPVSSWKSEDRHRRDPSEVVGSYEGC